MLGESSARVRRDSGRHVGYFIVVVGLVAWSVVSLSPVIATLLSAIKPVEAILANPLALPAHPTWSNLARAWDGPPFGQPIWQYGLNSAIAVATGTLLTILAAAPAAYALARNPDRFMIINSFFFILLIVPALLTWIPLFNLASALHMLSSPLMLGLIYAGSMVPLAVVLIRAHFARFPGELVEAARVDGATELLAFRRIVIPLSRGTIGVVSLLVAVFLWNELALAAVILQAGDSQTIPLGVAQFRGQYAQDMGAQYAALAIALLPVLALYGLTQRRFEDGLRMGGFGR